MHPTPTFPTRLPQGRSHLTRLHNLMKAFLLAGLMALLTAPGRSPRQTSQSPQIVSAGLSITMSPTLYPAFDPSITDYVVAYQASSPTQVSVNAPRNTKVSVDGQAYQKLNFTTTVSNVAPGQSFAFTVASPTGTNTYHVRCLPSGFPGWTTEHTGNPAAQYYVIAPNSTSTAANSYVIIVDNNGIPMWWHSSPAGPYDAKMLSNGNVAWVNINKDDEEYQLDGKLVHTFPPASSIGGVINAHEIQLLSNGDYIIEVDVVHNGVDLSAIGGSVNGSLTDNVIEEVKPDGTLVWSWSAYEHLALTETEPQWRQQYIVNTHPADPFHMNSIEENGDGFVVSLRHLDAIIRIDKATGKLTWKLGGVTRPESLTFVGDPYGNFGGQHYARILADGTLTLHDNGTNRNRAPRGAHYSLDTTARTATFLDQITDPDITSSGCCGSATLEGGGSDWVLSWGQNHVVTVLTPQGQRLFRMTFTGSNFTYRAVPIPYNVVSPNALRAGMDTQHPR